MTEKEVLSTAMALPSHLKAWLKASGRAWLVINGDELVDALPWPGGVQEVMDLVSILARHRATKPTGRFSQVKDPLTKEMVDIPVMKSEALEPDELDRAIRYLVAQMRQHDPDWSLETTPLG
jgi:hypothetical protein